MYAKKSAGEVVIKIGGLHYIPERMLQVGKDIALRNPVIGRCGKICGDLYFHGIRKGLSSSISTFFNLKWLPREVIMKIVEACQNVKNVAVDDRKVVLDTLTNCGIKLQTVIPVKGNFFITSYPTEANF